MDWENADKPPKRPLPACYHTPMDWMQIVAERKIQEAMDEGQFANLPGKGKPIRFDDDLSIPVHQRMAAKILRNARALPEWIQTEKDIEREQPRAAALRDQGVPRLLRTIGHAGHTRRRALFRNEFKDAMDLANTLILRYNAIAPEGYRKVYIPFAIRKELQEFDALFADADVHPDPAQSS